MIEMTLAPAQYWQPFPWSTTKVRISDDARRCVVFLGDCDQSGDAASFEPFATGFLMRPPSIAIGESVYFVTAKHCVQDCNPFWIRLNAEKGSQLMLIEEPDWVFHDDQTVDVAVMEFPLIGKGRHSSFLSAWWGRNVSKKWNEHNFGPGDLTYTVGLFRNHRGESRNIPLVHSGHIAAFYEDEKIRVKDWGDRSNAPKDIYIDAYVVQCAAMPGASGSPVFVRETEQAAAKRHVHEQRSATQGTPITTTSEPKHRWASDMPTAYGDLYLLGLWHGSWEADGLEMGQSIVRNPAGYGIVVPAEKIMEVLDMPKLKDRRDELAAKKRAAKTKTLPVADSLPRKVVKKRFDDTLKKMLDTPPDPKHR
jgi:hypothetical protein